MKALISRTAETGTLATVGSGNQTVVSHYKTLRGVLRFARKYANSTSYSQGKPYRVEFYTDNHFYGDPFKIVEMQ
jgi:hypothetical protein